MANYSNLKAAIADVIKTNGTKAITGQVLQDTLNSIVSVIGANYQFAGVATPSTNPGTPDQNVFYVAMQGGTYTNFNATALHDGISLLMWNGSWSSQVISYNDGGVFDISVYKSTGGTLATFADLAAALGTNGANVPVAARKGGMSVKFVQSFDNKYVQYRYMLQYENTTAGNTAFVNADNWEKLCEDKDKVNIYSINLVNPQKVLSGYYISAGGGILPTTDTNWQVSDYIEVKEQDIISNSVTNRLPQICPYVVYDNQKNILRTGLSQDYTYQSGDVYVRFQFNSGGGSFYANYGDTLQQVPYNPIYGYGINELEESIQKTEKTLNILKDVAISETIRGKLIDNNGSLTNASDGIVYKYAIDSSKKYIVRYFYTNLWYVRAFQFFNGTTYIGGTENTVGTKEFSEYEVSIPASANIICLNGAMYRQGIAVPPPIFVEEKEMVGNGYIQDQFTAKEMIYSPKEWLNESNVQNAIDSLAQKNHREYISLSLFETMGVVGDSYSSGGIYGVSGATAGDHYGISWPQILARKYGIDTYNFSASGFDCSQWLSNNSRGLPKLVTEPQKKLYIIMLGINTEKKISDGTDAPTGTMDDVHEDWQDNADTFAGHLGQVVARILDYAPSSKIIMIQPTGITSDKALIISGVAEYYGLPFTAMIRDSYFSSTFYNTNRSQAHPIALTYSGMANAFDRLLSDAIISNAEYFEDYT